MNQLTHVSLFSGCGGSSWGFRAAGFKTLLAVEFDPNAAATYRTNFPTTHVFEGDIATLTVDQALTITGLRPGELVCMDMSPPCQGFSLAGQRSFDDPRNTLFREAARLLRGLQPQVFVLENVRGLVVGKMRLHFEAMMNELRDCGYDVAARLLNAKFFNVPQSRDRVIVIGVRRDLGIKPSHPPGNHKLISVREAWEGVVNMPDDLAPTWLKPSYAVAKAAHQLAPGQNPREKFYNLVRLSWSKPSPAVCKSHGEALSMAGLLHPTELRRPTIKELKRLASFPDDFVFLGGFADAWARIGNCVPPRFMQAIAEHVRDHILSKINVREAA